MIAGSTHAASLGDGTRLTPEVCVIGSGAGGAVTAAVLAAAGHDVLVLEEGDHRTSADFNMREDVAFSTLYEEGAARVTKDQAITVLQGRTVGGSTVINWTTSFRTPDKVVAHWRARHGVGGFTSADLAPHFAAVEERLHIAEIPLAESNRNNRLLYDGCKAIGLDPHPIRRNVKQCMKTGYCGLGCPVDAKQSMLITYLPDAVARGARIVHHCRVERLEIAAGRIVRAECAVLGADGYKPDGKRITIEAKRFVLSGGAINSPAVLLRSGLGSPDSPLGRRTFLHPVVAIVGKFKDPVEPYYGAPQSIACHLPDRGDEVGLFLETAPVQPMSMALLTSGFGEAHHKLVAEMPYVTSHLALSIDGFHDHNVGGTVHVRPSGVPLLDYPIAPSIWRALRDGLRTLVRVNLAAGAEVVRSGHDPALEFRGEKDLAQIDTAPFEPGRINVFSAHVMGGCAMGDDPKTSVVRSSDLRHHTIENLHVIDGSVFPTSLGVNPQLSVYGLARLMSTRIAAAW